MSKSYIFNFPPEFVLNLCGAEYVKNRSTPNRKGEVLINCPVVKGKSFDFNLAKGTWHCFKGCASCPAEEGGGVLSFYRLYHHCDSNNEAFDIINKAYSGKNSNTRDKRKSKSEMMKPVAVTKIANPDVLDAAYSAFLNELTLTKAHTKDLLERGLSKKDIEAMQFKSIPQTGLKSLAKALKRKHNLKGVPGFYEVKGEPRINCFGSGYFIPYRNPEGKIVALQIRYDIKITKDMSAEQIKSAKQRRYRWFTSSDRNGGAAASNIPFYGIPGRKQKKVVYATEGGLKAATAQSLSNGWFVAIPGVNCYTPWRELLKYLKKCGVEKVVDAFDSDRATNPNVANSINNLHKIAKEEFGIIMESWDWGTEQKGVDDYLLACKKEREKNKNKV